MLISCLGAQERGCTYHGSNNHFVPSVCHCNTASSKHWACMGTRLTQSHVVDKLPTSIVLTIRHYWTRGYSSLVPRLSLLRRGESLGTRLGTQYCKTWSHSSFVRLRRSPYLGWVVQTGQRGSCTAAELQYLRSHTAVVASSREWPSQPPSGLWGKNREGEKYNSWVFTTRKTKDIDYGP